MRKAALGYPQAYEELPWAHHAIKVKGKTFVFLAADAETVSLSAKLPSSAGVALRLPYTSPTEYGLGRSGWVTARFPRTSRLPLSMLKLWIEESYQAIAPKRLLAERAAAGAGPPKIVRRAGISRRAPSDHED